MLRLLFTAVCTLAISGCVSAGAPVGARVALDEAGYRPFVRTGLATAPPAPPPQTEASPLAVKPGARDRVVDAARALVGQRKIVLAGHAYPDDCTGLVKGVFAQEGLDLAALAQPGDNGVSAIYRFAQARGRVYKGGHPVPGDLVFFTETYDKNKDGARNDGLTHVGLVDALEPDGTVTIIHRVARGVVRYRMNLEQPDVGKGPGGRVLNDWLRMGERGQTPKLTAQLFYGYATLLPVEPKLATR
jgi:peptidoglycan DL-endopeptidase CwlO